MLMAEPYIFFTYVHMHLYTDEHRYAATLAEIKRSHYIKKDTKVDIGKVQPRYHRKTIVTSESLKKLSMSDPWPT